MSLWLVRRAPGDRLSPAPSSSCVPRRLMPLEPPRIATATGRSRPVPTRTRMAATMSGSTETPPNRMRSQARIPHSVRSFGGLSDTRYPACACRRNSAAHGPWTPDGSSGLRRAREYCCVRFVVESSAAHGGHLDVRAVRQSIAAVRFSDINSSKAAARRTDIVYGTVAPANGSMIAEIAR